VGKPCRTVARLLVVILLTCQTVGNAQEIGSPEGIKSEQSLPSRYDYVVQDLLRFCEPAKGFWIDLGAGKGQVAIPLIEKTSNPVTMLDPNENAMMEGLDIAREKGLEDRLFAVVGVAEDMPFPDNSVNLIASRGSIFFWTDPVKGLQEVFRVLRPGGKAYIGGGAGSGYPQEAVTKLIEDRKRKMEGNDSEKWKKFVRLRRPEQMQQWAEGAGLPEFQVMGKGAISAEDERVGQGVWLLFEKRPEITTRKEEDKVTAQVKGDTVTYTVTSPSGIGGATITPWKAWPKKIVLRLNLAGLESLAVSNGKIEFHASVLSHSGTPRLLSVKERDEEKKVERGGPYWTEIQAFNAKGKPVQGLPGKGGHFEIELPPEMFEAKPRSLAIAWIDFYRN
jgi:SAM-dependent methyltransferase